MRADGTIGNPRVLIDTTTDKSAPGAPDGFKVDLKGNIFTAVEVKTRATFEVGVPRALFSTRPAGVLRYDATSDGQQFLVAVPTEETSAPATVVLNWFEELKRRVPSGSSSRKPARPPL